MQRGVLARGQRAVERALRWSARQCNIADTVRSIGSGLTRPLPAISSNVVAGQNTAMSSLALTIGTVAAPTCAAARRQRGCRRTGSS